MKLKKYKKVGLFIGAMSISSISFATNIVMIEDLDFFEGRAIEQSAFVPIAPELVPELPIPVLEEDKQFLLIELNNKERYWVSKSDVDTDNESPIVGICQTTIVSKVGTDDYSALGVGEACSN